MKILTRNEIIKDMDYEPVTRLVEAERLFERLKEKYGEGFGEDILFCDLCAPVVLFGRDLKKKTVLDLGCGSIGRSYDYDMMQKEEYGRRHFEPWLCRALHELGIRVIGIDYGRLNGEEFEHYEYTNLLNPESLKSISDNSVDLAHARLLYTSPQLERMISLTDKKLMEEVKDKSLSYWSAGDSERYVARTLEKVLLPQLKRIVKPDGFYVHY